MGPKFGAQKGNKLGSQLGPMSITKLSPNWACQMGPIHCINFLLSGWLVAAEIISTSENKTATAQTVYNGKNLVGLHYIGYMKTKISRFCVKTEDCSKRFEFPRRYLTRVESAEWGDD